ncbi:hypothetical protein BKA70DRAFT_1264440 [Coprinopsis sp. MPI-PUGE-AT-0042]|nr:hypothetical protein BKA70DRAFT_1264440 [Coprinopsis sp. MPI-PUGE-AT-0042]
MITFYDIECPAPLRTGSPNTWKTRLSLNYKGIPYKTEWVDFPDMRALYDKIGAKPHIGLSGAPNYSLPLIKDDSKGVAIGESFAIAKYLDDTYPDTPKLIPNPENGGFEKQAALVREIEGGLFPALTLILRQTIDCGVLTPRGREYFAVARAPLLAFVGIKVNSVEEVQLSAEEREAQWGKVHEFFDAMSAKLGGEGKHSWFLEDTISFADFALAGLILCQKELWGEGSKEWKDVMTWNGGKWAKFIEELKDYQAIV